MAAAVALAPSCGRDPETAAPPASPGPAAEAPGHGFVETGRRVGMRFKMEFLPAEQGEKFHINLYDHGAGVAVGDVDGDGFDDVYFLNQLGKNALFRNDGHGAFTETAAASGVAMGDRVCVAAAFGDVDGDGDQDLYVTSTRGGNAFFRNEGGGRFVEATAEAGLTLVAHSQTAAFFDYDLDGDLDLIVTNTAKWTFDERDPVDRHYLGPNGLFQIAASPVERNVLYRNDGKGLFADVTAEAGVAGPGWGGDVAVVDYDGDGRPDLLVGNMFGSSTLWHNEGGGKFKDVTRAALGRTSWGAVGVKAFDYDGDGRFDLMLTDMHSDMWMDPTSERPELDERRKYAAVEGPMIERGLRPPSVHKQFIDLLHVDESQVVFGNTLFRNLGDGRFEETSDRAGAETFWPWGVAAADFDEDGAVDAFVPSGMGYPLFYWPNRLLMNRGDGTFAERSHELGIDPPPGGEYLEETVGGRLATRSSRAAAVLDYDGDGRPDLVVANFNDRASLFHNEFPKRSWIALRLRGTTSNRDAVGALVTVTAGGRRQVRQVDAAGGYLAQSTKTVLFGLAAAAKLDAVEIRWPNGFVQKLDAPHMNEVNVVTEPDAASKR